MSKQTVYTITITLNDGAVNEAARHVIPKLIRTFGAILKVRLALVTSVSSWSVKATVMRDEAMPWANEEEFDLTVEENDDDGSKEVH